VTRSTLIYDGNCFFCTKCAEWFSTRSEGEIRASQSFTDEELASLSLSRNDVDAQVWWVEGPERFGGADGVGRALLTSKYSLVGRVLLWRAVLPVSRKVYAFVSSHRSWFSKLIRYFY